MTEETAGPGSLLPSTVRRAIVSGRIYLLVGSGLSIFYAVVFSLVSGPTFSTLFPILIPLFAVMGSLGGLMVFTNDRLKGVLEYLIAYGVPARRIFTNILLASFAILTIILGAVLAVGLGVNVLKGRGISAELAALLLFYSLPMSYASVAFAATIGMFWSSLSSPREGMSSPVGLIPIIGLAPAVVTLVAAVGTEARGAGSFFEVTTLAVLVVAAIVVLLLASMDRLMRSERLLSPT